MGRHRITAGISVDLGRAVRAERELRYPSISPSVVTSRTVTEHAFSPERAKKSGGRPQLGVLVVHSRKTSAPVAYVLTNPQTLGRDASADIELGDPGVSRVHARLEPRGGSVWVTDLGSRNGTYVNGARIGSDGVPATPGMLIRVGKTLLVLCANVSPYLGTRPTDHPALIGGASLDGVRTRITTIASTKSPVLIVGETGTGKEVVARAIHEASGRPGAFVGLNCAAIPSELVDAELFGHSRGAFSGAANARIGLFRTAQSGTLFLDEIGEMPATVQAKLLRVLETEEVRAVGDDKVVEVDTRVVAATNRNVDEMVESRDFRGDLLYRLSGLRIALPTLLERIEDVPLLAEHFAQGAGVTVSTLALERMMLHSWPGNVRELRNTVTAAAQIAKGRESDEIQEEDVGEVLVANAPSSADTQGEEELHQRVSDALRVCNGHVGDAAVRLGISRSMLYEALKRLRIDPKAFRSKV